MGLKAQDGVPHIVIVGHLGLVEKDHIFQLGRVAHHAARPDQGLAPDKGAVAHLGLRADDAGAGDAGRRGYLGGPGDPDILRGVIILLGGQRAPQREDKTADARQGLPGVFHLLQQGGRLGVGQVI